ncbi:type II toxin-antitoxin system HicA family toxin [Acaryochloris sp. IP29b_bin.137]|uniref:type II toxin-antitoxin system HicA family toxin n=1 Tax=Acaryochloris sp. IP29b_bin.137 TaxID=2969217 RepID=UPI0026040D8D|nr:type II toxin-antitoxin system HicA family toxin [Acaryochloris sp. IP29b_bin.137]
MNSKHKKTLAKVLEESPSANIQWKDVESLLVALGANISERSGSRIAVSLNDRVSVVHRPHPKPNAGKGLVRSVKQFLINAGIGSVEDA